MIKDNNYKIKKNKYSMNKSIKLKLNNTINLIYKKQLFKDTLKNKQDVLINTPAESNNMKFNQNSNIFKNKLNLNVLNNSFYKDVKEHNNYFLKNYNKVMLQDKDNDKNIAFKDMINKYKERGYKIPNLSIENNLFSQSSLLTNNNNIVKDMQNKYLSYNDLYLDKLYLTNFRNNFLSNKLNSNNKRIKSNKKNNSVLNKTKLFMSPFKNNVSSKVKTDGSYSSFDYTKNSTKFNLNKFSCNVINNLGISNIVKYNKFNSNLYKISTKLSKSKLINKCIDKYEVNSNMSNDNISNNSKILINKTNNLKDISFYNKNNKQLSNKKINNSYLKSNTINSNIKTESNIIDNKENKTISNINVLNKHIKSFFNNGKFKVENIVDKLCNTNDNINTNKNCIINLKLNNSNFNKTRKKIENNLDNINIIESSKDVSLNNKPNILNILKPNKIKDSYKNNDLNNSKIISFKYSKNSKEDVIYNKNFNKFEKEANILNKESTNKSNSKSITNIKYFSNLKNANNSVNYGSSNCLDSSINKNNSMLSFKNLEQNINNNLMHHKTKHSIYSKSNLDKETAIHTHSSTVEDAIKLNNEINVDKKELINKINKKNLLLRIKSKLINNNKSLSVIKSTKEEFFNNYNYNLNSLVLNPKSTTKAKNIRFVSKKFFKNLILKNCDQDIYMNKNDKLINNIEDIYKKIFYKTKGYIDDVTYKSIFNYFEKKYNNSNKFNILKNKYTSKTNNCSILLSIKDTQNLVKKYNLKQVHKDYVNKVGYIDFNKKDMNKVM